MQRYNFEKLYTIALCQEGRKKYGCLSNNEIPKNAMKYDISLFEMGIYDSEKKCFTDKAYTKGYLEGLETLNEEERYAPETDCGESFENAYNASMDVTYGKNKILLNSSIYFSADESSTSILESLLLKYGQTGLTASENVTVLKSEEKDESGNVLQCTNAISETSVGMSFCKCDVR